MLLGLLKEACETAYRFSPLKWHLTPDSDISRAHEAPTVINLSKPYSRLLLLLRSVYPDAQIDVKFVARQEHPPKLTDELNGSKHVLNVLLRLEVVEV